MRHIHEGTGSVKIAKASELGDCAYYEAPTFVEIIGEKKLFELQARGFIVVSLAEWQARESRFNLLLQEMKWYLEQILEKFKKEMV